jgi:hypothetical protein
MFLSLKRSSPLSSSMSRLPNRHFSTLNQSTRSIIFGEKKVTLQLETDCAKLRGMETDGWIKTIGRSVGRSNLSTCDLYLFAVAQSGKKEHFGINNLKLLSSLSFDQFFPFFTLLRLKSRVGPIQQRFLTVFFIESYSFDEFFPSLNSKLLHLFVRFIVVEISWSCWHNVSNFPL